MRSCHVVKQGYGKKKTDISATIREHFYLALHFSYQEREELKL